VFFGNVGTFVLAPMFLPKLPYDAKRDFQPINGIGASNNILVCSTERPFRSVRDLLEYRKSGNNELTYAGGVGSMQHVAGAMFAQRADLKMTLIPYNNFTQALNDVALGRVDLIFDYPLTCIPLIRNGKLRALATNGSERLKVAPDIPTFTESGVGGVELFSWSGLYAPSDVAQTLIKNMQRALVDALHDPNLTIRMEMAGTFLWPNVGATRMRSLLDEDIARISALKIENTSPLL
jgi:tripartite-type tricarboxylate transporter receptor subunit TctC